ncbi:outer membrane protein RatA [Striga asiatica]|uniref:Outer membrane protein RatA n=1 Tax=Striga asiatica TaxID=4170 RepID=A0A5A7RGS7_STRAF|nr:outer membrane protein RatA [Striga asiatica]
MKSTPSKLKSRFSQFTYCLLWPSITLPFADDTPGLLAQGQEDLKRGCTKTQCAATHDDLLGAFSRGCRGAPDFDGTRHVTVHGSRRLNKHEQGLVLARGCCSRVRYSRTHG